MIRPKTLLKGLICFALMVSGSPPDSQEMPTLYITVEGERQESLSPSEWADLLKTARDAGIPPDARAFWEAAGQPAGRAVVLKMSEAAFPALGAQDGQTLTVVAVNPTSADREVVLTFPASQGISATGAVLTGTALPSASFEKGYALSRRKKVAQRFRLPAGSLLTVRVVNHLPAAQGHLNALARWGRSASGSAATRRRWTAACNEISRNLYAAGRLLGTSRPDRSAGYIHRALLASAQIETMGLNLARNAERDGEMQEAVAGLRGSLSDMSSVLLGIRVYMRVEGQGEGRQATLSLVNAGRRAVKWLTFRLLPPSGWRVSDAAGIPHPRIEPGQTLTATFRVTPSAESSPTSHLEGDIAYFYANSAVHLKMRCPAR